MKRKALFFDIDGTLLVDASKELPKSAALALTEARRAGHLVFINSGRTRCLMKDVEGKVPVDGYLCGCGTYIEAEGSPAPQKNLRKTPLGAPKGDPRVQT